MPEAISEVTAMFDCSRNVPGPDGVSPSLTDDQRHALFVAQLQVLPDDWSRAKASWTTWRDFGRALRAELSAPTMAA